MLTYQGLRALLAAACLPAVLATISFPCARALVEERADPLLSPGAPSPHVHKVVGSNAFNLSESYDETQAATCSSCPITKDLSNYWMPKLYHHDANGDFTEVLMVNESPNDKGSSGFVIYYNFYNHNVQPFPKGLRMIAGDATLREPGNNTGNLYWDCGSSSSTPGFPNQPCNTLVARITFPSCWNGVDLAPPGFTSHVTYPTPECPPDFPIQLPFIGLEAEFRTSDFPWPGYNPFVLSNGDATGYSLHADFLNGWDVDTLARVIYQCPNSNVEQCDVLETFSEDVQQACFKQPSEIVTGTLSALPGRNPVTGVGSRVIPVRGIALGQH